MLYFCFYSFPEHASYLKNVLLCECCLLLWYVICGPCCWWWWGKCDVSYFTFLLCVGSLISSIPYFHSLPHLHGLPAILYIIILQRNNSPRLPFPVMHTFELLLHISARTISARTTKFWPVFCVLKFDELTFSGKDFSVVHLSL